MKNFDYLTLHPNWNLAPHSRASNSFQLFEELISSIKEEPLRIEMNQFHHWSLPFWNDNITQAPECGMVACIGGWIFNLTLTEQEFFAFLSMPRPAIIEQVALSKLPKICHHDAYHLFWGENVDPERCPFRFEHGNEYPFPDNSLYGTKEYVAHVVANIRTFMNKWETQLKEFQLTPIPID